jgi:hypothetical protein
MLENKKAQQVFDQMRDDSSSLYVLCDTNSFVTQRTKTTTATSRYSVNFAFDPVLLQTRAYRNSYRSLLKRVRTTVPRIRMAREDSEAKRVHDERKVLLAGPGAERMMRAIQIIPDIEESFQTQLIPSEPAAATHTRSPEVKITLRRLTVSINPIDASELDDTHWLERHGEVTCIICQL